MIRAGPSSSYLDQPFLRTKKEGKCQNAPREKEKKKSGPQPWPPLTPSETDRRTFSSAICVVVLLLRDLAALKVVDD